MGIYPAYLSRLTTMFTKIAPKRFLFSIFLITTFIGLTLTNLKEADQLFADIQNQISDSLGWLIILLTNVFLVFVIYLAFSKHKTIILGGPDAKPEFSRVN
jgi:choline/glycine/proline betaine transport protein